MSPAVHGPPARSLPEEGAWERTASPASSREEALRRLGSSRRRGSAGRRKPLPSFAAAAPRATWPPGGRACAPAPSPGGRRASDSGGGDGAERETRRRGEGRRLHLAPVRRPGRGRAGLDPRQPRRSGGGGEPPASPGGRSGTGEGNLPHPGAAEATETRAGVGRIGAPFPSRAGPVPPAARALQLQEIPEALHHPGAARRPGCQGFPKESHMPAGRASERATARPALAPTQSHSARQPRSPACRSLPAPRGRRNAWQPRPGAILSGRGAARSRCFRLFPGPRPASRGPRLPAEEGHVEGEERAASIRLQAGEGPGRHLARLACSAGRAAELLTPPDSGRWLRGARYLHAPPPVIARGPGTPSPAADSGLTG